METYNKKKEEQSTVKIAVLSIIIVILVLLAALYGIPKYNVYRSELQGQAELARASQNRQIRVQEAMAAKESAKLLGEAEIERAKGVAEANKIIGDSLKGNEAYLRYLWINNLENKDGKSPTVIYVPTEAGMPILEAGKR